MKLKIRFVLFAVFFGVTASSHATDGKTYPGSLCKLTNITSNRYEKVTRPFDGAIYNDYEQSIIVRCPVIHDELSYKARISFIRVNVLDKNHFSDENINCEFSTRYSSSGYKKNVKLPKSEDASNEVQHLDTEPYNLWTSEDANLELVCRLPGKVKVGNETRRSGITSYRIYEKNS